MARKKLDRWFKQIADEVTPETCPTLDLLRDGIDDIYLALDDEERLGELTSYMYESVEEVREANSKLRVALARALARIDDLELQLDLELNPQQEY